MRARLICDHDRQQLPDLVLQSLSHQWPQHQNLFFLLVVHRYAMQSQLDSIRKPDITALDAALHAQKYKNQPQRLNTLRMLLL